MTRNFIASVVILTSIACKTKKHVKEVSANNTLHQDSLILSTKQICKEMDIEKEIVLNAPNDTSKIIIHSSNIRFVIHYFNNKPQGILIQNNFKEDSVLSHFVKDNKGVFINMNPKSNVVDFLGYKYLRNGEGVDLSLKQDGTIEQFTIWQQYSNEGKKYDIKEADAGKIKVYTIKDGEKVDSSLYLKK